MNSVALHYYIEDYRPVIFFNAQLHCFLILLNISASSCVHGSHGISSKPCLLYADTVKLQLGWAETVYWFTSTNLPLYPRHKFNTKKQLVFDALWYNLHKQHTAAFLMPIMEGLVLFHVSFKAKQIKYISICFLKGLSDAHFPQVDMIL